MRAPSARFPLYAMDPRLKLLALILLSLACSGAGASGLGVLSLLAGVMIAACPGALVLALRTLRATLPLLLLVLLGRALTTPGEPLLAWPNLPLSMAGVYDGALICWRLVLVTLCGQLLVSTTSVGGIKAAIEHLLRPLPLLPEKRIATLLGLSVQLIPLVMAAVRGTDEARLARGAGRRRNPLGRVTGLAIPAMRRIFASADQLALAMEARLYNEARTVLPLRAEAGDWQQFYLVAAACALALML